MTTQTQTQTQTKPHYLGLLNRISLGESGAGVYLKCWADTTPNPEVKKILSFVADRESSHGRVFRQRIERLGYTLQPRDDGDQEERVRVYGDPSKSDLDKLHWRMAKMGAEPDPAYGLDDSFTNLEEKIADESIDALTRHTLRWYVSEERDSIKMLRTAFACIDETARGQAAGHANGAMPSADTKAIIACMTEGFATLQGTLAKLGESLAKKSK